MKRQRFLRLVCIMALALVSMACAQNAVNLTYPSLTEEIVPNASAPRISVVLFEDMRTNSSLGTRSDGTSFVANSDVRDWVSRGLATELTRQGAQATFAMSVAEAEKSGVQYIITGAIKEISLLEKSSISYTCTMATSIKLLQTGKTIYGSNYTSNLSRQSLPGSSVPQNLLSEGLQDIVKQMATAIMGKVGSK